MKNRRLRKSVAGVLTGLVCVMSTPVIPTAVFNTAYAASVGQTLTVGRGQNQHKEDNVDGYSYEIWLDQTGGSGSMTLGSGGSFNTEWSAQVSAGNFLARRGRNYDASKKATQYGTIVMDYAADYSASAQGNSRLCVYGWFKDPLVEYYIIEDWVNWRPTANGGAQTVTIDGAEYEIFQLDHTGPTILGDTRTFKQYFSVRKQKRTSGTITVSDHFAAWEKAGWNIGNLTEVALNVEGWESSGKANVSKLTIGNTKTGETTTTATTAKQNTVTTTKTSGGTSSTVTKGQQDLNGGLKGIFAPWFKMGTSVSPYELSTGASFIKENYNSITPENELKPESIIDQSACQQRGNNVNTQVNLSRAAQTLKFCEENGISLRGHTFVWYSQTPDWFFKENFSNNGAWVSKEVMDQRLESFIKNTFAAIKQQYPKLDLYAYDVCNELFVNDGGGLRPSKERGWDGSRWVQIYGDDSFVINAFKYARQYAPEGCQLYLNDYNEYMPAKTQDICNMAKKILAAGDYIDGIGMQSHLDTSYPSAQEYETALKAFIDLGLDVQITELDITCKDFTSQANLYEGIFKVAMENSDHIPSLTIWGTQDSVSWRKENNPLLFSQGYQPKPAYDKVVALAKTMDLPAAQNTTTATTAPAVTTTTQPSTKVSKWGDANVDGDVSMADAVIIMQSIANPSTYKMTAEGQANGDVNLTGNGITNADALAIQKYMVGLLKELPESYSESSNNTGGFNAGGGAGFEQTSQKATNAATTTTTTTTTAPKSTTPSGQKFSVRNGSNRFAEDDVNGYSYEIWLDQTGGSGSMTLGDGGTFNTEWSAQVSAGNFLARRGRNYDRTKKATDVGTVVLDYEADYSASAQGNSRLCVYGWTVDPLVEYYIIEDWVNWRPTAQGGAKTVTIDGAEYEIFQLDHTGPTILGDTRTFKQYFSVRKDKRTSGTITVSDHFKAWADAGWEIGNLTEIALNVEGWESSGKANVSKLEISGGDGGGSSQQTTAPQNNTTPTTTTNGGGGSSSSNADEFTPFNYEANKQYKEAPGNYFNACAQQGKVIKESYNGINGGNNLNVYLPYGYDENKKYNIFYLMHGGGENENTLFYQDDTRMQNLFDNMIMNGELEPLIVVTPTFNKTEAGKFYSEFRQSVVPFVEGKYSTYAGKDTSESSLKASRMHRAYGGFSMGSVSTWAVFENCLDIVGYFMPLSGDHWNGNSAYDKAKSLANAVDKSGLKSNQYFIFSSTGSDDIAYPNVNPQIEEMKKMSQFKFTSDFSQGNFYFMVAPGKTHWWGYVRHYVYDSLPYFFHESGN